MLRRTWPSTMGSGICTSGMQRAASGGVPIGQVPGSYVVAETASAVLAFEVQGHLVTGDPAENPYVETVQRGLNFLFSSMATRNISTAQSPYGDPDTNGNGIGIDFVASRYTYEIGIGMMALAASGAPDWLAPIGPTNVVGRSYRDILTDMVDVCAWGQTDTGNGRGGWRYQWNSYDSDNSITQWPVIGMEAAEANWGVMAPDFVKRELELWLNYSQSSSGTWGYTAPNYWDNPAKAGAGIAGLNFIGVPTTDDRIQRALTYLNNNWGTSGQNGIWGEMYALYGIMKGMRTAEPEITMIGSHDWYAEFSDYLVDRQNADGSWPNLSTWGGLPNTAFAILVLTPTVASPPPVADLTVSPLQARPEAVFTFDGSDSYHLDATRSIVRYEWDFGRRDELCGDSRQRS
jgi:large repetitive protein